MEVALLNSLVLTSPGCYKADKITIQEVHDVLGWCGCISIRRNGRHCCYDGEKQQNDS